MIRGEIDTTYQTQQRDLFASGLAREIGVNALAVWMAYKSFSDFHTGETFPGVRKLMAVTGLASKTVQNAIDTLLAAHLLREVRREGRSIIYVARERLDVRVGPRVICTVVVDYVPTAMRERLAKLRAAASGELEGADVWAEVDVLPGPGFTWDQERRALRGRMRADEVPEAEPELPALTSPEKPDVLTARQQLRELAIEFSAGKSTRNSQRRR